MNNSITELKARAESAARLARTFPHSKERAQEAVQAETALVSAEAADLVLQDARDHGLEYAASKMTRCILLVMAQKAKVSPDTIEAAILKEPQGGAAKTFATIAAGIIAAIQ